MPSFFPTSMTEFNSPLHFWHKVLDGSQCIAEPEEHLCQTQRFLTSSTSEGWWNTILINASILNGVSKSQSLLGPGYVQWPVGTKLSSTCWIQGNG